MWGGGRSKVGLHSLVLVPPLQVKERGGDCLPVVCDSSKEDDIKQLFERIKHEQNGRLDILVNNAYAGVQVGVGQCPDTVCLCMPFRVYV